ncbi:hypothetical protein M0804_007637 [Polistes exclamans]|nr:hypothetical protein M0804_007637 [Polistes exclamans]
MAYSPWHGIKLQRMSVIGLQYYKQHFIFSNQLIQFFLGLDQYRSQNQQLVLLCIVTVYTLPMIVHQSNAHVDINFTCIYVLLVITMDLIPNS